jgi:transposase
MLLRHALLAATHPAGAPGRKYRALARRIHKRETDYLQFAHNPAIPFTNNSAEQEIRMTKIRQKVSGTMRTEKAPNTSPTYAPTCKPPRNTAYKR